MIEVLGKWLYDNAMAIFISAIASLIISKIYYDKANRDNVLMAVIYPIVKILEKKRYSSKNYERLIAINFSYAVKYLKKEERNKLLALLNAYRVVCRYSKEEADTNCVLKYFDDKLKSNGIDPKTCPIYDDNDENIIAYEYPREYNYLANHVYEIVSSYDFIEFPEKCEREIASAFKRYTKKYYRDKDILYFGDYSIEQVIKMSEVSRKWKDKFRIADEKRREFLELPICKKVQNIIDKSNLNEYVAKHNSETDDEKTNY